MNQRGCCSLCPAGLCACLTVAVVMQLCCSCFVSRFVFRFCFLFFLFLFGLGGVGGGTCYNLK